MAIYMDNTNDLTVRNTGQVLSSTFLKAFYYTVLDEKLDNLTLTVQYGFYFDITKWFQSARTNKLKVEGLEDNRTIILDYSRTNDGPDMEMYIYNQVKADLLTLYPTWDPLKLEIITT